MDWCRHFNGIMNKTCRVGVAYADVRVAGVRPGAEGGYRLPCIESEGVPEVCEQVSYFTVEEKARREEEIAAAMRQFGEDLAAGRCPACHQSATKRQVGRCVYGEPCGHRMYQGKA